MESRSVSNVPRYEYFQRKFDEMNARFTDVERRINDANQKLENMRQSIKLLEDNLQENVEQSVALTAKIYREIKKIEERFTASKAMKVKVSTLRLPL